MPQSRVQNDWLPRLNSGGFDFINELAIETVTDGVHLDSFQTGPAQLPGSGCSGRHGEMVVPDFDLCGIFGRVGDRDFELGIREFRVCDVDERTEPCPHAIHHAVSSADLNCIGRSRTEVARDVEFGILVPKIARGEVIDPHLRVLERTSRVKPYTSRGAGCRQLSVFDLDTF
jgi:hypothetical protein